MRSLKVKSQLSSFKTEEGIGHMDRYRIDFCNPLAAFACGYK